MAEMTYILWDWNGTLLDDTQAALDTFNTMLARRGKPQISMSRYRNGFSFPVKPFYADIGFELDKEDWDAVAVEYHDIYDRQPKGLNAGALEALSRVGRSAAGQSIVSLLRQDMLVRDVAACGIDGYMDFVFGAGDLHGASKADRARELMAAVRGRLGTRSVRFVVIGDSLHDKEVADVLGVDCVLCAQGSHAPWRLRAAAPTGDTLAAAVEIALEET